MTKLFPARESANRLREIETVANRLAQHRSAKKLKKRIEGEGNRKADREDREID